MPKSKRKQQDHQQPQINGKAAISRYITIHEPKMDKTRASYELFSQNIDTLSADLPLYLEELNFEIKKFIQEESRPPFLVFPDHLFMRNMIVDMCTCYNLATDIKRFNEHPGSYIVCFRLGNTTADVSLSTLAIFQAHESHAREHLSQGHIAELQPRGKKAKSGRKEGRVGKKVGVVVGGTAKPLDASNMGHKMMLGMGWKPGQALGSGDGLVDPINAVVRSKRGGLGTM